MPTATSEGHTRKRPYQPPISSYFNSHQHRDPNAPPPLERTASPLSPPIPVETQSSLLNVGMRVRKSVPEGYKTHKTMDSPGSSFSSTAPPASTEPAPRIFRVAMTRELTPFCALHRVGGLAAQESPTSSAPAAMETDDTDEDEMAEMTTSQSTLPTQSSSMSFMSTSPSRKRAYEEEMEDEMDAYFDDAGSDERNGLQVPQTNRLIARMKKSPRIGASNGMNGNVPFMGGPDWEEATFLTPPDGMDMDES